MFSKSLSKFLCACFPVFVCLVLHAQTQGGITGEITDASGAVIPKAKVTVTNEDTNAVRVTNTNGSGQYNVPSLLPGSYSVAAEAVGFEKMVRKGIQLQVEQIVRSDFQMAVGQVDQIITVSTAAPLLDTEDVTVGTVIGTKRITDMPLNGRDFLQLVSLSPNVVYNFAPAGQQVSIQGGQRAQTTISIAGQRGEFNYYTLDGLADTDDNFNDYLLLPSIDALQEFKVQYGIYPAEYGRNVGQINVSSLSGSNVYHGALWDFIRNSVMDAYNYDFTTAPPLKSPLNRNQFGYTLGGPVIVPKLFNGRNRLFFMTNYEGQRWYTSLASTATVPTLAMRGQASGDSFFDFSASGLQKIYDPATETGSGSTATAQQFPNNQIPLSRIDKNTSILLQYYPAPNVAGATTNNYQILNTEVQNSDQFTVRIDLNESAKSTWFGRYSWSSEYDLTPSTFPNQGIQLSTVVHQAAIGNTRMLTPNLTNQFLFGYSGLSNILYTQGAYTENVIGAMGGIPGLATPEPITYGIPSVGVSGYTGFGDSSTAPDFSHDHTFQTIDNVTLVRGKHTIGLGLEIRRDEYNQEGNQFVDMSLGFINGYATANPAPGQSSSTGNAFADFILGIPNNSAGPVVPLAVAQLRATDQYYYAQDTWKIRPNLTITAGLRYELEPPYWAKHDELMNTQINQIPQTESQLAAYNNSTDVAPVIVREGNAGNFYAGLPWTFGAGIPVAQDGRLGKYLVNDDRTMIAPRVGLAYTPSAKWSIRSGFGRFYAIDVGNAVYDMSRNLAVRRNVTGAFPHPNLTLENPFGLANGSNGLTVTGPTILSNWVTRKSPYEFQYELVVQRQLTSTAGLEVGYEGSEGHHLDRFRNLNVPPPEAGTPQLNRPDPILGLIQEVEDYVNSGYNSMEVKFTQQLSHGVNALIGYTYSRSIDNGSAIRSHGGDADFPQSDYCIDSSLACGEVGPSNFNQTQRLVSSLLYEPPIGRGQALLNHGILSEVFGNWQFNEIFSLATGLPFTFSYSANILNGGGGNASGSGGRPNYTGQPLAHTGGKNWHHWFNTAAYQNPPLYQFGNVSRNSMYGPGVMQWDSSLMKNFPVHNEQQLQFRFEAFNAANHPNFGLPSASFGSTTFSQISTLAQASSNRELQLSLKFVF
jgi:hypothetical protein